MAQVILNETDGRIAQLFGEYQAPIASIVMDRDKQIQENSIARKIFAERKSTHRLEGYTSTTAIDTFEPTVENGEYPTGGFESGYDKQLTNVTWKGSFGISMEAREDGVIDLNKLPNSFFYDYERKFEGFYARLLGEAIKRNSTFNIGQIGFNTLAADGQCVFSKAHPRKVKGGNQSNWFADKFSGDALGGICEKMQNVEDDDGNIMNLNPDTIIIPNISALAKIVFAVLGSNKEPGTANNDYNYLFENFRVIKWARLNQFITAGTLPYIVMDSNYNDIADCCVFQNRKELEVRDEISSNDAYLWKGNARYAGGFVDWRGVFLGGITGGSAL